MAYIGKTPVVGNFQVCDAISVVNGQAAYTLQVGGANVIPESANHMLVSLNGILQKPGSSFTISGSTMTFASNLATGDVIDFVQILGNVLDIGTPSDATVTTAKLGDGAVTSAKLSAGKVLQVVQTVKDTKFSTTSTSFTDVTGLSASITPSSSSNKILITASFCTSNGSNSQINMFNLLRGSTAIGQPASSQTYTSTRTQYTYESGNMDTVHLQLLDSPSTTSATTYKIQGKCNGGTLVVGNRNDDDSEQISIITLMEVSA